MANSLAHWHTHFAPAARGRVAVLDFCSFRKFSGKLANSTSASGEFPQIEKGIPLYISVTFAWFDRPVSLTTSGRSIKVETVNSSPARFGKNSANFLRTPKAAK